MSLKVMLLDLVKTKQYTKEQAIKHLNNIKYLNDEYPSYKLLLEGEYEEILQAINDIEVI